MFMGPSPRGRGNLDIANHLPERAGAIPAWAGEPAWAARTPYQQGGHPRVGGGTSEPMTREAAAQGPSPRGRGNHRHRCPQPLPAGAIPAWAGEPRKAAATGPPNWGHPRVGGGTRYFALAGKVIEGPSPRGRGNRTMAPHCLSNSGAIPAWAGEPRNGKTDRLCQRGHPRVGGGTGRALTSTCAGWGPSPRGRGNLTGHPRGPCGRGAIPAWAGEPLSAAQTPAQSRGHPRVGGGTRA